jgi:hypothetical protein
MVIRLENGTPVLYVERGFPPAPETVSAPQEI